jgi:serine/threonine-protein kinase RsbW
VAVVKFAKSFPASAEAVGTVRHAATAFAKQHCGHDQQLIDDIALAVTEAAANIVCHAYPGAEPGTIELGGHATADALVIEVSDSGSGMSASGAKPGLGFGLTLIRQLADLNVVSNEAGTRLRMTFSCSPS